MEMKKEETQLRNTNKIRRNTKLKEETNKKEIQIKNKKCK